MITILTLVFLFQAPKIRVVACDAPVQSRKRGVCANHLEPADFVALAPGVSWWYDWYFKSDDNLPEGVRMEFVPMAWGDRQEDLAGLEKYLAAGNRPRQVLAINEPNIRDQAFISPERTAVLYRKIKAIADKYGIPVTGPQMAIGSKTEDSIKAVDPIDGKETTYTFMVPFLKAFLHFAEGTPVRALAIHPYGDINEDRWAVATMQKEFQRPLWITEFAHVPNPKEAMSFLIQSVDFFERTSSVEAYAWFKERAAGKDSAISLLAPEPGKLTDLGKAYLAMPVHDKDLYYRIPGRLEAVRYVSMQNAEIFPTSDVPGIAQMTSTGPGATLDYNLQVDKPGVFTLRLRVSGPSGKLIFSKGDVALGTIQVPAVDGWRTVEMQVRLAAGPQTLRLHLATKNLSVGQLEFAL